eukprot:7802608-Pyramimonas_sp.AAC.1
MPQRLLPSNAARLISSTSSSSSSISSPPSHDAHLASLRVASGGQARRAQLESKRASCRTNGQDVKPSGQRGGQMI